MLFAPPAVTPAPYAAMQPRNSPSHAGPLGDINETLLRTPLLQSTAPSFGRIQAPARIRHVFTAIISFKGPRRAAIILGEDDVAPGDLDAARDG